MVALAAVVLVMGLLVFATSLVSFTYGWSLVSGVGWHYALLPLAFAIAILAGVGLDVIVKSWSSESLLRWVGAGFGAAAVFLLALWLFGHGHLPAAEAAIRNKSFIWPTVDVVVGLVVIAGLSAVRRADPSWARGRLKVGVVGGMALLASSRRAFSSEPDRPCWRRRPIWPPPRPNPLQATVGDAVVGYGEPLQCIHPAQLGILPNVNIVYGIQEFGVYDPIVPRAYYESWGEQASGTLGGLWWWYCPAITTVAQARLYGISFVLERAGSPGPPGRRLRQERRQRSAVPDSGLVPGHRDSSWLPRRRSTRRCPRDPVRVRHPNPATWKMQVVADSGQALRLRLTDVPGWQATIDGKPLALHQFSKVMLKAASLAGGTPCS